jgi:hypothetical protein
MQADEVVRLQADTSLTLMSSQYVRTPDELDVYKRIRRFTSTSEYVAYVDEFSIRENSRRTGSSPSEYVAYVDESSRRETSRRTGSSPSE